MNSQSFLGNEHLSLVMQPHVLLHAPAIEAIGLLVRLSGQVNTKEDNNRVVSITYTDSPIIFFNDNDVNSSLRQPTPLPRVDDVQCYASNELVVSPSAIIRLCIKS
ncbi:uncharacterized protein BO66DRAFT_68385 [Aspergillus aculeatinus CBS 121060]|uniref:Uncharacterized protein n=1 Tax=Aspergillus aculeatinus CBS 121060 TaxID=1448322 RepID=A0ACD1HMN5_9EURO|nr:hypothetical protein BO66DRAFT_68385 [Aspergillus aculeatinus CBS 121060]RAH74868.1 hypothetical protein BO66DRAFT_68385 [Aspergillus aculeatinus CBS 121060]